MHRIGFLLSDGFQMMALATQSVFEHANTVVGDPFYHFTLYSAEGGEVRSSVGFPIGTHAANGTSKVDTWLVAGVADPFAVPTPPGTVDVLRRQSARAQRVAGICTGGFVLAEAGLLSGRRVTTHWAIAAQMQARFPDVLIESDRIFIVDGRIWTSAGMTAGLDLALAMVEKDLGMEVARSVAHRLVMPQRRSGGQTQHAEMLELAPKTDRIQNALNHARQNLHRTLSVEELAEAANLSPRQFHRLFTQETGKSPAKAVEALRLEAARLMIERSRHTLDAVARETGFRDRRHMREAFVRGLGVSPQAIRRDARAP
ncbi:GlxA family transcriptional regulator [Burkholderia sp. 22PA0099]|uniref:GlxA family transcriptional regulator n=1 Tax=Burkholderia sp. 22PA0099 TaxID=3237372 RepID=UPI0039C2A52F